MIEQILPHTNCPHCNKTFKPTHINQKYCSDQCRKQHYKKIQKEYYQKNRKKIRQQQKNYREKKRSSEKI